MSKFIFCLCACLIFIGCARVDDSDPVSVVENFILYAEAGEMDKAEVLLAPKNDVDYFRKYRDLNGGKDMFYIDYDYKGNDDTIELKFEILKNVSSVDTSVVKLTSTYFKQNHSFEKAVILNNIDGKWKIQDFLIMPVKVR